MSTRLGYPIITKSLLKWLQDAYKPRCYGGGSESLEEHLKLAGKVELIDLLAGIHEQQSEDEDAIAALARHEAELIDEGLTDGEAAHVAFHSHTLDHH